MAYYFKKKVTVKVLDKKITYASNEGSSEECHIITESHGKIKTCECLYNTIGCDYMVTLKGYEFGIAEL
jgi:hypothetical protein